METLKDGGDPHQEKMKVSDTGSNPPLTLEKDNENDYKESHENLSEIQMSRAITLPFINILLVSLSIVAVNSISLFLTSSL